MMRTIVAWGGRRAAMACVVGALLAGFMTAPLSAGLLGGAAACAEVRRSGPQAAAYCPRGKTYCAGFVLFCCYTGEAIGPCFGAWGCRWDNS